MNEAILVTSATGTVGREVVKQLAEQGAQVVAAAHQNGNAAKLAHIRVPGVAVVEVDYRRPESLAEAMSRVGELMLISPYTHDQVQLAEHIVKSAQAQGIRHMVVLSGYNVEDEEMPEIGKKLYAQEQLVRESGIPYTFLRACNFMQNFINYYPPQPDGNIYLPMGESRMNLIDARDIARLAVKALTEPGLENKAFRLATASHTLEEISGMLSQATGKMIRYVDVPPEALRSGMESAGVPEWMIGENLQLLDFAKAGRYEKTTPVFEQQTGRSPISFAQFARDYKDAFAYLKSE
jgi:uncharacterized protein YbjT (DUF2867 family)